MANAIKTGAVPVDFTVEYRFEFICARFSPKLLNEGDAAHLKGIEGEVVEAAISPIPTAGSQFILYIDGVRLDIVVLTGREHAVRLCGRKDPAAIVHKLEDGFFECTFA